MNEITTYSPDRSVMHVKTLCPVCKQPIHTEHVFLRNGKTTTWDSKCNCNNQETLEKQALFERNAIEEKKRDITEWGFHDKARREDTFEKDRFKDNPDNEVRTMKFYATHFLDEFYPRGNGMMLVGAQGTGKTFRSSNIANYIVDNYQKYVLYYPLSELVYQWSDFKYRDDIRRKIQVAHLMIIDDFMLNSDRQIQTVYEIVECRCSVMRPLIVSTNIEPRVLKEKADIERARIYSRIMMQCSYCFSFTKDEDMRVVIARENFQEMKKAFDKELQRDYE